MFTLAIPENSGRASEGKKRRGDPAAWFKKLAHHDGSFRLGQIGPHRRICVVR